MIPAEALVGIDIAKAKAGQFILYKSCWHLVTDELSPPKYVHAIALTGDFTGYIVRLPNTRAATISSEYTLVPMVKEISGSHSKSTPGGGALIVEAALCINVQVDVDDPYETALFDLATASQFERTHHEVPVFFEEWSMHLKTIESGQINEQALFMVSTKKKTEASEEQKTLTSADLKALAK